MYMKNELSQTVERLEGKKAKLVQEVDMLKTRGFSPKSSDRYVISPDRGMLTMSSGGGSSFLNLPMKHTTHKYSIQPYRKPTTSTACGENISSRSVVPKLAGKMSRSPIGRINTESNSPGRRTMVSGTMSDSITAVGDNDSFLNLGESEAEHYNSLVKAGYVAGKRRSPLPHH